MSETVSSAAQWMRSCSLVVAEMQGNGIELAGPTQPNVLRIRFTVNYWTERRRQTYMRAFTIWRRRQLSAS